MPDSSINYDLVVHWIQDALTEYTSYTSNAITTLRVIADLLAANPLPKETPTDG
jgi:hypothetical protein